MDVAIGTMEREEKEDEEKKERNNKNGFYSNTIDDLRFAKVVQSEIMFEESARPNINYWKEVRRVFFKNKIAVTALVIFVLLVIISLVGPHIRNIDYVSMNMSEQNQLPSAKHWFGTDNMGRDLFCRLCNAVGISLLIAVICTVVSIFLGSAYGAIAAYVGGFVDEIMMRVIEILNSIPSLILILLILVVLGNSIPTFIFAMVFTSWTGSARMIRGKVLQLRQSEYVLASEVLGATKRRIVMKHLLPNAASLIILDVAGSIPGFVGSEAGLSFLGLGLQPPAYSLGSLLSLGQQVMAFYPHQMVAPAVLLAIIILTCNLIGDGLRDALDPQLRN
ncbi:ABC transporter permease [Anaeromicropila herbilytica]|uniref:Diguanylate cyclase n=1 Tax=Anaeromicropila herbilytica TaxID=2785025 RepID=A0A7R7IDQ7_9FIRM|nr:ABC transporter permease [Anaeromicropila herbilytica]BCN31792.1 diguanylate cyclase [Anaeromicropila herbilytica]